MNPFCPNTVVLSRTIVDLFFIGPTFAIFEQKWQRCAISNTAVFQGVQTYVGNQSILDIHLPDDALLRPAGEPGSQKRKHPMLRLGGAFSDAMVWRRSECAAAMPGNPQEATRKTG
jgi:hypothetical protein